MNIFILDDEIEIVKSLTNMLNKVIGDKIKIYGFTESSELINNINTNTCDILFLDIKLNNQNGIDLVKANKNKLNNTKIIYITGYDEYVEDVFETDLVYLIKKPLKEDKVLKAYTKALDKIENSNKYILIKTIDETRKVKIEDIYYIESDARIINIHLYDETLITYAKLGDMESLLRKKFLRVHKSYLVNLDKVKSYRSNQLVLENDNIIPISRNNISKVKNEIFKYLKERR